MSRVDIFLLAVMKSENKLSLAKIVQKIRIANINKSPSRIGVYQRLNILKSRELVNVSWTEQEKFYQISPKGISAIAEFKNQLERAQSA